MFYRHQIILHTNIEKTAFNSLLASLLIIIVNNLDPDLIQQLMKGLILIQTVCQPDGIPKILVLKKKHFKSIKRVQQTFVQHIRGSRKLCQRGVQI